MATFEVEVVIKRTEYSTGVAIYTVDADNDDDAAAEAYAQAIAAERGDKLEKTEITWDLDETELEVDDTGNIEELE